MKVLTLAECKEVVRRTNNAQSKWKVAESMGVPPEHITLITRCKVNRFPLTDYLIIDIPNYHLKPIREKDYQWDIRLSQRLAKLPMSEWGAAV
jgi:hypothetical protein